jgi:hypothetical protein
MICKIGPGHAWLYGLQQNLENSGGSSEPALAPIPREGLGIGFKRRQQG